MQEDRVAISLNVATSALLTVLWSLPSDFHRDVSEIVACLRCRKKQARYPMIPLSLRAKTTQFLKLLEMKTIELE